MFKFFYKAVDGIERVNTYSPEIPNLNFHPLIVVSRYRDSQL